MKQLSLICILVCLLAGAAGAATISGTLFSATTCAGVSGQKVYIRDSLGWRDSLITGSTGAFSFTIPASILAGSTLYLSTSNCGLTFQQGFPYNGSSIRSNIVICGTPTGGVYLNVRLGTGSSAPLASGPFVVYLIRRDVDPVTLDTTLTAVDSSYEAVGYTGFTWISLPCVPAGTYLMKAALRPGHPNYASYLPTYHDSSLNWNHADTLTTPMLYSYAYANVWLVAGTNPGGPGFIGGSVLLGANKSTAVGDPLSSRILLLTDALTGKAVAYTHSDASGQFRFPSLPYGTYKIFGDAGGKTNPPLTVTLSTTQQTVNNIVFEENDKTFKGHFNTLGVGPLAALPGVSVFPNPVTDFANVYGLAAIEGSKTILLSNITGAVISRQTISQGADATVSTAGLPAGVYLMQVQTEAGNASFRIMKQK
jgi:hypothetical protein